MKILVMGLPSAGKTFLASELQELLQCAWYNADKVREMANDWDFSDDARLRQAARMKNLADFEKGEGRTVICDFVCPTEMTRHIFDADYTIWVDTIDKSKFEDTNNIFEPPKKFDARINVWLTKDEIKERFKCLIEK
jgi:adenylylsulfate kinase